MATSRNCSAVNRRIACAALALLALASCHRSRQEQAAKDEHDVALVQQAQQERPPLRPIRPEPVSFADLRGNDVRVPLPADVPRPGPGAGCTFAAGGKPLFVAVPEFGLIRVVGQVEVLAADSGSTEFAGGVHRSYAGSHHALQLVPPVAGKGPWRLQIRDRFDRVAYAGIGDFTCAAKASGST